MLCCRFEPDAICGLVVYRLASLLRIPSMVVCVLGMDLGRHYRCCVKNCVRLQCCVVGTPLKNCRLYQYDLSTTEKS
jgi:hypothetical protein